MSGTEVGTADDLERIAGEYRKAFDEVQGILATLDLGSVPPYVFAIDRFDVKDLAVSSPKLAKAEQRRRQWRAALHAMAELTALQSAPPQGATIDPDAPESLASMAGDGDMGSLDRFISVLQYARSVGCMYVDGRFEPVFKGGR
ncbi:MAG: hypothetical protein H6737_18195 [Alphaproteobacteria bacterium]|nr:hypothetical protein [Alphaproteobacteria bacterium]